MAYIHQHPDWPRFHWDWSRVALVLAVARYRQGLHLGRVESLGPEARQKLTVDTLTTTVVSSSRIARKRLDAEQVRSSVARQLGLDIEDAAPPAPDVDGLAEVTVDSALNHDKPLTRERLHDWHRVLYPTGFNNASPVAVGKWRDGPARPRRVAGAAEPQ